MGNRTRVKVVKNKMAPPFREVEFDIMYGQGISREGSILDLATELNVVEKSGSWFGYQGERLGQGRDNVKQLLTENTALAHTLEQAVLEHYGLVRTAEAPMAPEAQA
jgi:recombination protein RecA